MRSRASGCRTLCGRRWRRPATSPSAPRQSWSSDPAMPYQPASKALEGLVVLDLTHARAGPICVRQLADWGANVVRIERPGDPADFAGRHEADFQNKHRNKRALALNLRSDEGRAILYGMAERADVLVENFRPDVKMRLQFDYETLKKKNPRLVFCSISAFGQD